MAQINAQAARSNPCSKTPLYRTICPQIDPQHKTKGAQNAMPRKRILLS